MMAIELNECEEFFSMISFAVSQWKRPCYTFYISFCFGFCVFVLLLACIFVRMMFNTSKASIAKKNVLWSFVQFRLAVSLFAHGLLSFFFFWDWNYDDISNHYPRVAFTQKDSLAIGSLDSKIDPQLSELSRFKVRPATDSDVILEPRLIVIYKALDNRLHF